MRVVAPKIPPPIAIVNTERPAAVAIRPSYLPTQYATLTRKTFVG
jgi:hypothetical protein